MSTKRRGWNEGSIRKRSDGSWEARYSLPGGRRGYLYGRTRRQVAEDLTKKLAEISAGLLVAPGKHTVKTWALAWLATVESTVKHRTYARYASLIHRHVIPGLGGVRLAALQPDHLERFYRDRLDTGLSAQTVKHLATVIGTMLQKALKSRHVAQNVARLADSPRVARYTPRPLSPEEARTVLGAAAGDRYEALFFVLLYAGLRLGEALALRWSDVDLDGARLRITGTLQRRLGKGLVIEEPKTAGSSRTIRLAAQAVAALRRHREQQRAEEERLQEVRQESDLVFATEIGTPASAENIRRRHWYPLLARVGLAEEIRTPEKRSRRGEEVEVERITYLPHVRLHDCRHTTAVMLLQAGEPISIVAQMFGHRRTSTTTDMYGHLLGDVTKSAADTLERILGGTTAAP